MRKKLKLVHRQQVEAVLESGMNAVITKPYNLKELLKAIQPPEHVIMDIDLPGTSKPMEKSTETTPQSMSLHLPA